MRKQSYKVVKGAKPTKKNSWVDKDLTKSPKKKCFEKNGDVWNAIRDTTTKNWVEEKDLNKFPIQKRKRKTDTKETVKMSRLCKAGLFFLR